MTLPPFLFHGTDARHAISILTHGLVPGGRDGADVENPLLRDERRFVYLGLGAALAYASRCVTGKRPAPGRGLIIETNVSQLDLRAIRPHKGDIISFVSGRPDARFDAIILYYPNPKPALKALLENRMDAGEWSAQTHPQLCATALKNSLELLHFGTIPLKAITRVAFVERDDIPSNITPVTDDTNRFLQRLFDEKGIAPEQAIEILKADKNGI